MTWSTAGERHEVKLLQVQKSHHLFAKLSSVYPGLRAGACQVNEDPGIYLSMHRPPVEPVHRLHRHQGVKAVILPSIAHACWRWPTFTCDYLHNLYKIDPWIWLPNGTTLPQATCVKTWKGSRNDTCGLKWHWLFLACPMTGWPLPVVFKQMPIPTHKLNGRIPRKRTAVTLLNMTATLTILFEFSFINSWSYLS